MATNQEDPHHCHCFSIHDSYFTQFRKGLKNLGFKEPLLQENHGQVFGLTKRLDEYTQIHVKVMKNGNIEAEMEYPPDYPFAHLNKEHSYSAHSEVKQILDDLRISRAFRADTPISCIIRKIKKALNPTPVKTLVAVVGVTIGLVAVLAALSSMNKEEE